MSRNPEYEETGRELEPCDGDVRAFSEENDCLFVKKQAKAIFILAQQ